MIKRVCFSSKVLPEDRLIAEVTVTIACPDIIRKF